MIVTFKLSKIIKSVYVSSEYQVVDCFKIKIKIILERYTYELSKKIYEVFSRTITKKCQHCPADNARKPHTIRINFVNITIIFS